MLKPALLLLFLLCLLTGCAIPMATPTPTITATTTPLPSTTPRPTSSPTPTPPPERYVIHDGVVMERIPGGDLVPIKTASGEVLAAEKRVETGEWVVFLARGGVPVAVSLDGSSIDQVNFTLSGKDSLGVVGKELYRWDGTKLHKITPAGANLDSLVMGYEGVFVEGKGKVLEWRDNQWQEVDFPEGLTEIAGMTDEELKAKLESGEDDYAYMDARVRDLLNTETFRIRLGETGPEVILGKEDDNVILRYKAGNWFVTDSFVYHYSPEELQDYTENSYRSYRKVWEFTRIGDDIFIAELFGRDKVVGMKITDGKVSFLVNWGDTGDQWAVIEPSRIGFSEHRPDEFDNPKSFSTDTLYNVNEGEPLSLRQLLRLVTYFSKIGRLSNQVAVYAKKQVVIEELLARVKIQETDYEKVLGLWENGELEVIAPGGGIERVLFYSNHTNYEGKYFWFEFLWPTLANDN